jgi:hypothetical protein
MTGASCTNTKPYQRPTARQHRELAGRHGRNTAPSHDFEDFAQSLDTERQLLHHNVLAGKTAYIWIYYATGSNEWTADHRAIKDHKAGWKQAKIWKDGHTQRIEWAALARELQFTAPGK